MAKATFDNEQLCKVWAAQAKAGGSRSDVVRAIMVEQGANPDDKEAYRKMYNNVTQRVKQLASHPTKPVKFPELAPGKKGARRSDAQMESLQSIFAPTE